LSGREQPADNVKGFTVKNLSVKEEKPFTLKDSVKDITVKDDTAKKTVKYPQARKEEQNEIQQIEKKLLALPTSAPEEEEDLKDQEQEPCDYEWIESGFIKQLEQDYEDSGGGFALENASPEEQWLNIRLRCLIESIIKLDGYAFIDRITLYKIAEAFALFVKSRAFAVLEKNYRYHQLSLDLFEKLRQLYILHSESEEIPFRLSFKRKARLVSVCQQMKRYVPQIKFSELAFEDADQRLEDGLNNARGELLRNKERWQDRYRYYQKTGLLKSKTKKQMSDEN
jgi:hypothetical protein